MEFNKKIVEAKICPYCAKKPEYVDSKVIYGTSYGMVYYCKECDAYVGVHRNSTKPLGRLANRELREAKKKAHFYFDQLWQRAIKEGRKKYEARNAAYKWLSTELNISLTYTHIGMFDVELCDKVIEICKPYCKNKIYETNNYCSS